VAHVPEDRLGTGVSPSLSIAENLIFEVAPASADVNSAVLRNDRIRRMRVS